LDILGKRKWLNLNECAKYLRKTLNDDIGVSDVARLIADGELKPSIFFHSCCFVREVQITSKTLSHVLSEPETAIASNIHLLSQEALLPDTPIIHASPIGDKIIFIEGVWSALHIGIIKYEAERKYSEEQGLPKPKRSLYETKGIILADGERRFQVVQKIDFEREMIALVKLSQSQREEENGFFKAHIERFEQIKNAEIRGDIYDSFVPCVGLPENAYFAIKKEDIDEFVSTCMPASKKSSSKTTNKQAELIYALIAAHYGEDIANNPRSHIDNADGAIRIDIENKGLTVPSGNTVSSWLKNIAV
jgi:hypothetical protein